MESMKEITVNVNGMGAMQVITAVKPLKDGEVPAGSDVVVTSGEDGILYVTDLATETIISEKDVIEGQIPSFAVLPDQSRVLIVSEEDNALYSYSMPPAAQMDALIVRSTVAIRQVVCSDKYIALAEDDPKVRVILRADTDQVIAVEGAQGAIKSVTIDPSNSLLCVASEDGFVRVYELDDKALTATQLKEFKVQYQDIRDEEVFVRCAWQPTSAGQQPQLLAVPTDQGIVELYDRKTWQSSGRLLVPVGSSKGADVNIVAFSPNGLYVAGATMEKEVFVWAVADSSVVRSFRVDYSILSIQWANTQNTLVVHHSGGKFGFVKDAIPAGKTPPHFMGIGSSDSSRASVPGKKTSSPGKTAPRSKPLKASAFVEDEAAEDNAHNDDDEEEEYVAAGAATDDEENEFRVSKIKAKLGFGTATAKKPHDDHIMDDDTEASQPTTGFSSRSATSIGTGVSPLHSFTEPFQPGSVQGGSGVSLLAWTPAGEIESLRGASLSENLVKVEFVDKSRRGFKFNDNYMFTMGFLDDHGAIFAVPRRPREERDDDAGATDDIISSYVFYRPFESWASNSSWHLALPDGEDAECVAAAREFCAVATSLQCLRIYTTSGIEYALVRLPGRVVTMTAKGSLLAVVFQGLYGQLRYQLLRIQVSASRERVETLAEGVLPMTPPPRDVFASHKENQLAREDLAQWSTLKWLGFDDRLILYSVDSFGCVQALSHSAGWSWIPVGCVGNALNKKPGDRHGIFTLGVVNDSLLFFPLESGMKAPRLRGKHRPVPLTYALQHAAYPKTSAPKVSEGGDSGGKPVNTMWQNVKLAAVETNVLEQCDPREKHAVEDQVVREQAEMDKALILMMKAACTSDEPARVLDLAKCLHLEKSHQIAQKLAIHYGLRQLQTQLYDLYRERFEQRQTDFDSSSRGWTRRDPHAATSHASAFASQGSEQQREPLKMARNVLARPRAEPQPRPDAEEETSEHKQEAETSQEQPTSQKSQAAASSSSQRSVAPANPFLKKPKDAASDDAEAKSRKKSGLERLAKFASPPPKKRRGVWK